MDSLSHVFRGLFGFLVFLALAYACSSNRKAINWRLIAAGVLLQFVIGGLVLHVDAVRGVFDVVGSWFVSILDFNKAGAEFLFGGLVNDPKTFGFIFAFNVLPTIIFFSALTSLLFYLGILQKVVLAFAWVLSKTMNLSGAESLSASGNIFLGQTEAPLLIRPYLNTMTRSELLAVMVGGMSTIAGGVMMAYIALLGGEDPAQRLLFTKHLLTASVMSAPAALVVAKLLIPQTEEVNRDLEVSRERIGANALESIAIGTTDGVKLAVNVGAMLLVFTALIALVNGMLSGSLGEWTGLNAWIAETTSGRHTSLSLQYVFGVVFAPVAWLMGVSPQHLTAAGQLIGEKTILNEFYAYNSLAVAKNNGTLPELRDQLIVTYALCGFSNIASIGIQVGGIGALAPEKRSELARLGWRALLGGSLACFLTACIAGVLS